MRDPTESRCCMKMVVGLRLDIWLYRYASTLAGVENLAAEPPW
jgi:hypothetical protein